MKLKKPAYREGIDFDAAYMTPTDADELLELMKSQPFADNRISYGPQVLPAPPEEQCLEGPLRLGNERPARARSRPVVAASPVGKMRRAVQLRSVQLARRDLRGQGALRSLPGGCNASGRCREVL
jgi:hypothetical protein